MKITGISIIAVFTILLLLALMKALVPDNSRYAHWYEKHSDWFGIIVGVLLFTVIILFG